MREIKFRAEYQGRLYDVMTRLPKVIRHPRYKGWHYCNGYVMRLITEHPFANKRGYVPEHRLVMEEYLSRFLMPWEKIHHRDQNRANNEFSNLELFGKQSNHAENHLRGERNPHGQFIANEPIFSDLKFRLYNQNTRTTKIYTLATLIGTTFRRGQFQFRGRFTGLKDKNGKEIYEGDVIAIEDHVNHVVDFKDGMFMWGNIRPYIPIHEKLEQCPCEIIGNIHENPDLLKSKKEAK